MSASVLACHLATPCNLGWETGREIRRGLGAEGSCRAIEEACWRGQLGGEGEDGGMA